MNREELIKALKDWKPELELLAKYNDNPIDYQRYRVLDETIKALEQEPCEDAISRQAVLDLVEDITDQFGVEHRVITEGVISMLPPVTPKPKTDVLDKIRAEIIDTGAYEQEVNGKTEFLKGINYCLSVIDKYKAESEV